MLLSSYFMMEWSKVWFDISGVIFFPVKQQILKNLKPLQNQHLDNW